MGVRIARCTGLWASTPRREAGSRRLIATHRTLPLPATRATFQVGIKEKTIPKTTSGKIQRRLTRTMLHARELNVLLDLDGDSEVRHARCVRLYHAQGSFTSEFFEFNFLLFTINTFLQRYFPITSHEPTENHYEISYQQ